MLAQGHEPSHHGPTTLKLEEPRYRAALTTIGQSPRDQGREAVRLLMRRMSEPDAPVERVEAASALVVRSSTAAPR